jgi:hypothetical protein
MKRSSFTFTAFAVGSLSLSCLVGCGADVGSPETSDKTAEEQVGQETELLSAPDDEYDDTPHGRVHKSCIYQVENNATIDPDGSVLTRGQRTAPPPRCRYKRKANPHGRANDAAEAEAHAPTVNGWIEDVEMVAATNFAGFAWFNELDGRWTVPQPPKTYHKQIDYLFTGLENRQSSTWILQPVLGYGPVPGGGGGNYWVTQVWYATTTGNDFHTAASRVNPGDLLRTYMHVTSCTDAGSCVWQVSIFRDSGGVHAFPSSISIRPPSIANYAFKGVLEAYNVTSCTDLPQDGGIAFTKVFLGMPEGPGSLLVFPSGTSWSTMNSVKPVSPSCGYSASAPTADSAVLFY